MSSWRKRTVVLGVLLHFAQLLARSNRISEVQFMTCSAMPFFGLPPAEQVRSAVKHSYTIIGSFGMACVPDQ